MQTIEIEHLRVRERDLTVKNEATLAKLRLLRLEASDRAEATARATSKQLREEVSWRLRCVF